MIFERKIMTSTWGCFTYLILISQKQNFGFSSMMPQSFFIRWNLFQLRCVPNPMCSWGVSQAYGPFLNKPVLDDSDLKNAKEYATRAIKAISGNMSLIESSLIKANSIRYIF